MVLRARSLFMIIEPPEIQTRDGVSIVQALVRRGATESFLKYSIPEEYACHATVERMDAFLVPCLPLALSSGEDIEVRGALSARLFYNVTHSYMRILGSVLNRPKPIHVSATLLDPHA